MNPADFAELLMMAARSPMIVLMAALLVPFGMAAMSARGSARDGRTRRPEDRVRLPVTPLPDVLGQLDEHAAA